MTDTFSVGDLVKTYKIRDCAGLKAIIINIDDDAAHTDWRGVSHPITVQWLNPKNKDYPVGYFHPTQLRKVS